MHRVWRDDFRSSYIFYTINDFVVLVHQGIGQISFAEPETISADQCLHSAKMPDNPGEDHAVSRKLMWLSKSPLRMTAKIPDAPAHNVDFTAVSVNFHPSSAPITMI